MSIRTLPGRQRQANASFDIERVRRDFPILHQEVHGKPLVYLDSAATAQKPKLVIETLNQYYAFDNANVHRGVHELSMRATRMMEDARVKVQRFLNARSDHEIVFTRGTTESINLVAQAYGRTFFQPGDEIIISHMEHHSNIVPWQLLCQQTGAVLRVVPISDAGEFDLDAYKQLLGEKTRFVSVVHVSNALGTVNPIKPIIELAHERDVPVLIDGAQAVPHVAVDVQELDCDFYVFSGHKLYGPTGIGVLYGKTNFLERMPPYQGGGDMIRSVRFDKTTYNDLPYKFEAGTPHIAGAIGLGAAIDYVHELGLEAIARHEHDLIAYASQRLDETDGVHRIGTAAERAGAISFMLAGIHPHDLGTVLDREGVAIRTGHHCCQPLMERYGVPATARASFGVYNTRDDIDALVRALAVVREVLG